MTSSFFVNGTDITEFFKKLIEELSSRFSSGELAGALMSALGVGAIALMVFSIVWLFFAVMAYIFSGFTRMLAGRKTGYTSDWMAFVPFAWDIYKLKYTLSPLSDLFFFGSVGVAFIIAIDTLLMLLAAAVSPVFTVLAVLVTLVWTVMRYIVTYKFLVRYYGGFGFDSKLAIITFIPCATVVTYIIDIMIAFKKDIVWTGEQAHNTAASAPVPPPYNPAPVMQQQLPMEGMVRGILGEHEGQEIRVKAGDEIILGRDAACCQIVFSQSSENISMKHCSICFNAADNKYIVIDYSLSGTFTGDERRLQPNTPALLFPGTVIFLGDKQNSFRLG